MKKIISAFNAMRFISFRLAPIKVEIARLNRTGLLSAQEEGERRETL